MTKEWNNNKYENPKAIAFVDYVVFFFTNGQFGTENVINVPQRGVDQVSIEQLVAMTDKKRIPLFMYLYKANSRRKFPNQKLSTWVEETRLKLNKFRRMTSLEEQYDLVFEYMKHLNVFNYTTPEEEMELLIGVKNELLEIHNQEPKQFIRKVIEQYNKKNS